MICEQKTYLLWICILCLFLQPIFGQDQQLADSLAVIYKSNQLQGSAKLELLKDLAYNESKDFQLAVQYADELIEISQQKENDTSLATGFLYKGTAHRQLGNLEEALDAFFIYAQITEKLKDTVGQSSANICIADVYSIMGNYVNAEKYYQKAILSFRQTNDSIGLASALLNSGDAYFNHKKYDAALQNFEEAGPIFEKKGHLAGTAYTLGNTGMVFAEQGKDSLAEVNINQAIQTLEVLQDYYPITVYLTFMSDIYLRKNNWKAALAYSKKSLSLAKQYHLKKEISDANLQLSNLYEQVGDYKSSNKYYKDYIVFRDSIMNVDAVKKMADLRTNYEITQKQIENDLKISKKQIEVDLLNQQKRSQKIINFVTIVALLMACIVAFGLFRRNKYIQQTNKIIEAEKNRSDQLLLNILPADTAEELKRNGKVRAKKFKATTVLFTDFEGFTHYAEHLSPEKLVESVDYYFSKFDEIIEKYGIEKIKTVGDAYMCAVGLHGQKENEAINIILAALEMIDFVEKSKKNNTDNLTRFDIRIGLNSGPVVAGVVGTKKFAYDIWGDTVNIASRMESNSQIGKINVTENTYNLIKNTFDCHYRGEIDVKNKGMMKMYFVDQLKSNITHNQLFSCN